MKIVAFTGMPLSGKSEAVKLAEDQSIPVIRMGDFVWEETKHQGFELNDKNVGTIANSMREKYGMDIWAKRTTEKIKKIKKTNLLVIDGVRNKEEIDFFKKELGNDFVVIAIIASDDMRRQRAFSRKRIDDSATKHSFEERDKRELHWGLGGVIASADIIVSNEKDMKSFQQHVQKILQQL